MSMNLNATLSVLFQAAPHPVEAVTLHTAPSIGQMKIDDKNIYHFLNSYAKRHGVSSMDMTGNVLRYCTVADGIGKGTALSVLIERMRVEDQKWIGTPDPRIEAFRIRLDAAVHAVGRDARAKAIQTHFEYILEGGGLHLVHENARLKDALLIKCRQIIAESEGEYPDLLKVSNAVLVALGSAPVPSSVNETIYANWQKLPSEPLRIRLQIGEDGGVEDGLLYADRFRIYSSYYKKEVTIYQHFNRYWKAQEVAPSIPKPTRLIDMIHHYSLMDDGSISLYNMLRDWKEGDEAWLTPCTIEKLMACDCSSCLLNEIAELKRHIMKLEQRYR
jgi:hypothetical protein